jgi:phosphate transporter
LKDQYLHESVEVAYPFQQKSKDRLNTALRRLLDLYMKCVTRGDHALAKQQLKLYQRENIAWERDTVWRQMIAQERRGQVEGEPTAIASLLKKSGPGLFYIGTPVGGIRVTKQMLWKIAAACIFVVLLNVKVVDTVEANRCFAILVFCTILWASEASFILFCKCVGRCAEERCRLYHYLSRQCSCRCFSSFSKLSEMTRASDCHHPTLQSM